MSYAGEHVEIFLLQWMLSAALCGFGLSLFGVQHAACSAQFRKRLPAVVNAFFLASRVKPGSLRTRGGPENVALGVMSVVRVTGAGALLTGFRSEWLHLIGLLLTVPPALSAPTFSLARGGDYFFAARYTLILSIVLPAILALLYVEQHEIIGGMWPLQRFFIVLVVALALPSLATQGWRRARPIAAGRLSTNWGWTGSLAADALHSGNWRAWAVLLMPFVLFGASRVGSALYVRLQQRMTERPAPPAVARDLHLLQTSPNIFLWLSLLMPSAFCDAPTPIAGTLLDFFAFALLDEAIVVRRFRHAITARVFSRVALVSHGR
ncbi:hypothetical protein [Paraburkholderia phosphatilytica]|uniref:hypothetical protein n=1 Tax=Paraburkholderia phosphatilytica TaxID=2282883 RepID=UPI000E4D8F36|nr:hypothetical protein [Paraburkholderia phosphatilytica]